MPLQGDIENSVTIEAPARDVKIPWHLSFIVLGTVASIPVRKLLLAAPGVRRPQIETLPSPYIM